MEKCDPELGIKKRKEKSKKHFKNLLEKMAKIGVGEIYSSRFCNLLMKSKWENGRKARSYKIPKTREEVLEGLQKATWLEKEDIKQYLLMQLWKFKIDNYKKIKGFLFFTLRDYIFKQKVFAYQSNWRNKYKTYLEDIEYCNKISRQNTNIDIKDFKYINDNLLSPYYSFLYYLYYGLDIAGEKTYKLISGTSRQSCYDIEKFNIFIKELYGGTKNTKSKRINGTEDKGRKSIS